MVCTSLESAHAAVVDLVNDFAASEAHYLSSGYSEAQARVSFIDKLWMALGWDVHHEHQKNPYAQEVKVEDPQKIAGSQRRADYAFHTAPNFRDARFFCEAKKPHRQLKTNSDAAFQTIRYGWSAGTPLGVLTDFEELHILDCRAKPDIDTALSRTIRVFHYKDWLDPQKFAELYYLFSREAFRDGGFDACVSKLPRPKKVGQQPGAPRTGSQPVDAAFLADLEGYRETLAKLLKAADQTLDGDALTELVQRILDRLVFLRFLEDKLIETEIQVQHFSRTAGGHSWAKFLAASRKLDARYNGIVFKQHPILDDPQRLPVDDARFADLCEELSHTKSPYDFNYIPIHILGSIYERFLGKVIVTTDQRARVEEKPEVRKAGGVYYTPEYIVRYICEQTVGRLIEGKSPAQIAKMRFADIACGSGSFLLGVYDLLIRTHGLWYNAHPAEALKENIAQPGKGHQRRKEFIPAVIERGGVLQLTLEKKREILLNNIFGVDLDYQACEVAQLSLYLKLLEDETTASAHQHYLDFHEALLPSLTKNVVCGNSLIGLDLIFSELKLTDREELKLRPMDFESVFPHIFPATLTRQSSAVEETPDGGYIEFGPGEPTRDIVHYSQKIGEKHRKRAVKPRAVPVVEPHGAGFDAIVGNPPYVRQESLPPAVKQYLETHYDSYESTADLYTYFMERCVAELLRPGGRFAYIVSSSFLRTTYGRELRWTLKLHAAVEQIVDFGGLPVFAEAKDTYVCIPVLCKGPQPPEVTIARIDTLKFDDLADEVAKRSYRIPHERLNREAWSLDTNANAAAFAKIMSVGVPLGKYVGAEFFRGILTGLNEAFELSRSQRDTLAKHRPSAPLLKAFVGGSEIKRYRLASEDRHLIVIPTGWTREQMQADGSDAPRSERAAWDWFVAKHPGLAAHLAEFETACRKRQDKGEYWWELRACDYYQHLAAPKLVFPDICKGPRFTVDRSGTYLANTAYCLGVDDLYLLGVLNSRLFWFTIARLSIPFGIRAGEFRYRLIYQYMEKVPIRTLDLTKPGEKKQHDRMVQFVEAMLSIQQQLAAAANETERAHCESKAAGLDRQIDELTYDLYGLTEEERALVQAS